MNRKVLVLPAALTVAFTARASAQTQETLEQRMQRLEQENAEQGRRLDVLADELEKRELGDVIAPLGDGTSGLGPAASKVYNSRGGVSIGGYGEMIFKEMQGGRDEVDVLRNVFYVGYKFDDTWVFNSETEFEHAVAGDGENGEVAVEFAFLDGKICESTSLRTGLVLVPMGLVNERHEPTTFPSANRPFVERHIIPTTWREPGIGAWGAAGPIDWRAYLIDGLEASEFTDSGIRGGRQAGSEATADDLAGVARADWHVCESLDVGGSFYYGHAGQELALDVPTTIAEGHAEWNWRSLAVRGLYAQSKVEDVAALNGVLGNGANNSIGETMFGGYVEVAFDLWSAIHPGSERSLEPFVRYEVYDTNAEVPNGFNEDPSKDVEVFTFGVAYRPNANIIFKLDFNDFDNEANSAVDQLDLALGFTY